MKRILLTTSLSLTLSAAFGPVWAAPATDEGVARLTAMFQRYLGTTANAVAVTAEGETYSVTIDPAAYAALIPAEAGVTVKVSPLELTLGDQGDGTWAVTVGQPFAVNVDGGDKMKIDYAIADLSMNGTFDEALMAFRENEWKASEVVVNETLPMEPGGATYSVSYTIAEQAGQTSAVAGAGGGVDGSGSFTQTGMRQVMSYPAMAEGMGPFELEATMASGAGTMTYTGGRPDAFLSLAAWFVAHPSVDAIKGAQDDLRNELSAGLPFFATAAVDASYTDVVVKSPMGDFAVANAAVEVDANGLVTDGRIREAVRLDGFSMPEALLPPWAVTLVPKSLSFDVAADGFNPRDPVRMIIEAFDLTQPEPIPETMGPDLLAALLPEGSADVTFAPGNITGADYSVTFEGGLTAGPMAMPTGKAMIRAEGLDKVEAALAAAPPDVSAQAMGTIMLLKGMGKMEGEGSYSWDIDATEPGKLLVNGADMSMMMGMGQ